ncbi:hypothetical protein C2L96_04920 [Bacillus cereus]|uniref:Uncharacterized protein n=1 Tax=Bacillus pacificus TaxID=2026187 RepID=A0ABX6HYY8_9BACI|nr:hypothetical protein [Klebsiella pneumoniae]PNU16729.1 hypothetical protein C2L96_04920 [Bacillus cereus]QHH82598.1 hypothetical protein FPL02_00905 [Bacillus paranthracis]QHH87620.1 hypothetical protein FPL01_01180 [Bacillus pacificus]
MNNEIIYVFRVFVLKQKELVVISTSSFCFSYCIRKKPFKYSRNNNKVFISCLLCKMIISGFNIKDEIFYRNEMKSNE